MVDAVVDFHESGDKPQPPDPQQRLGGVQELLRTGVLRPPEEPRNPARCNVNQTEHGTPKNRLAQLGHGPVPRFDTASPHVAHRHSEK